MRISEIEGMLSYVIENKEYTELSPLDLGMERCKPGKYFGPYTRKYYLIHFAVSGTGIFENPRGSYRVNAGSAFLIRPGESCKYTADEKNPWVYIWLGFEGTLASKFNSQADVFRFDSEIIDELFAAADMETGVEEYLTGVLFKLYASLFGEKRSGDRIKQICDFIDINYMRDIRVEDIADMLHMNRKYLARIFRESTGMTIKQYLTEKRLEEARKFLIAGHSVAEAARISGYGDSFNFSKAFKKHFGTSPVSYKTKGL